jgi:hypothetical protein
MNQYGPHRLTSETVFIHRPTNFDSLGGARQCDQEMQCLQDWLRVLWVENGMRYSDELPEM